MSRISYMQRGPARVIPALTMVIFASLAACSDAPRQTISQVDTPTHLDDLCPPGLEACGDEGTTRCNNGQVATCREVAPGCLGWSEPAACPLNQACLASACEAACPNAACDVPESRRCAPTASHRVERCADGDGDGCLDWVPVTVCDSAEVCSQGACSSGCVDECDADGARCEEGGVVTCADHDGDGCLEWGPRTPCDGACVLGACGAECRDECGEAGLARCDGLAVEVCERGAGGCLQWGLPSSCPLGTTCSLGTCGTDCADECEPGKTSCEAGGRVRCGQYDSDACADRGLPQACPAGESCSGGACGSGCNNECTTIGARSCDALGRVIRECRQADADECLEWVIVAVCSTALAETCSNGECAAECVDECDAVASRCASGSATQVERCRDVDADSCLEWAADVDCAAGNQVCAEGRCAADCSDECTGATCDGGAVVACGEFDGDGCKDRGTPVACSPGTVCAGGVCQSAPAPVGVKIAEVLYQSEGPDQDVFIEVGGPPGTRLTGFSLVAVNGADGVESGRYALSGSLDGAGRWVVAHPAAEPAIADWADATSPFCDLQNGPDNLLLVWGTTTVDALGYGVFLAQNAFRGEGEPAPGADAGLSLARVGLLQDSNDNARDFIVTEVPTPGRPIAAALRPAREGDLIITELQVDPNAMSDATGEWVELWNPSETLTWELGGCVLESDPDERHVIAGSLLVPPLHRMVAARAQSPGFTPDYVWSGISLANDNDALALLCDDNFIDLVTWSGATQGRSWSLEPGLTDAQANDDEDAWCPAPVQGVNGADAGTPGEANPPCENQSGTYQEVALDSDWGSCEPGLDWQTFAFDAAPAADGDATLTFQWWAVYCDLFADETTIEVELRIGANWTRIGDAAFSNADAACEWHDESFVIDARDIDNARANNGTLQARFRIDGGCPPGVGCGVLGQTVPYNCARVFTLEYPY